MLNKTPAEKFAESLSKILSEYYKQSVSKNIKRALREKRKMKLSQIKITQVKGNKGLIGFASLVVDEHFYISGIAIYERLNSNSYRLVYPTKKGSMSDYRLFYPINKQVGEELEKAVFSEFKNVITKDVRYSNNKIETKEVQNK